MEKIFRYDTDDFIIEERLDMGTLWIYYFIDRNSPHSFTLRRKHNERLDLNELRAKIEILKEFMK